MKGESQKIIFVPPTLSKINREKHIITHNVKVDDDEYMWKYEGLRRKWEISHEKQLISPFAMVKVFYVEGLSS
jgi:hypothetical protein